MDTVGTSQGTKVEDTEFFNAVFQGLYLKVQGIDLGLVGILEFFQKTEMWRELANDFIMRLRLEHQLNASRARVKWLRDMEMEMLTNFEASFPNIKMA